MSEILVYIEDYKDELSKASLEALGAGQKLGTVSVVIVANKVDKNSLVANLGKYGVETLYVLEAAQVNEYYHSVQSAALNELVEKLEYDTIVFPANPDNNDLVARLAVQQGAALLTEVGGVTAEGHFIHSVYGGEYQVTTASNTGPTVVTVAPGAFTVEDKPVSTKLVELSLPTMETVQQVKILDFTPASSSSRPNLATAKVVVAGGRGVGSAEGFTNVVEPLADALGAAVGASRVAVDSGYYPSKFQVGQTGVTVAPQLYLALGISGAIQHKAGMQSAKNIIVIDQAEDTPFFEIADLAIVGDLYNIVPKLTEEINRYKKG